MTRVVSTNFRVRLITFDLFFSVLSMLDTSIIDCEDGGQQHLIDFPDHEDFHKKAEVKSAYSMFKSMETKPITRSSTTTTSGSFYVKPSGEVDGSGYRTASSYDSTRRDGEQWMHSKSELSASEIEALKRLHGQGNYHNFFLNIILETRFTDFFTMPEFAGLHGSSGSSAYRQSSYSSTSQTQPLYGGSSSYHQIGQASESLPIVRPPSSGFTAYSKFEKHESSSPTIVNPGYSSLTTSDSYKPPIHTPNSFAFSTNHEDYGETQSALPVKPSYASSSTVQSYRKETIKTAPPVITTYPAGGATTQVTKEQYEYKAPKNTVMVPVPLNSFTEVTYNGEIFHTSGRPTSPNACSATDYSYKTASQIDVVALEKSLQELQCLAVLAENTMKAEVRALKEANTELVSRLHDLSVEFQKFRNECKCGY